MIFYMRIVDPNHVCKFEKIRTWEKGKRMKSKLAQCDCGKIKKLTLIGHSDNKGVEE